MAQIFKLQTYREGDKQRTSRELLEEAVQEIVNDLDARIVTLEASSSAGRVGFLTKAAMDADLDHPEGTVAEIRSDPTPANNGLYQKVGASGTGSWVLAEEDPNVTFGARVDEVEADVSGLGAATAAPSIWPDPEMRNNLAWTGPTSIVKTKIGDYPAFTFVSSVNRSPSIPVGRLRSGPVSFSFLLTKAAKASQEMRLREYGEDGTTILNEHSEVLPSEAVTAERFSIENVTLNSGTRFLAVVAVPLSGFQFTAGDFVIVSGSSAKPRPSLRPLERSIAALQAMTSRPNKVPASYMTNPALWVGGGTAQAVDSHGSPGIQVTGGSKFVQFNRADFQSDTFRLSVKFGDKAVSSGGAGSVRFLLRQRTSANATVPGTDVPVDINNSAVEGPQYWETGPITWQPTADHIIVNLTAVGAATITIADLCIIEGESDPTYRPSLTGSASGGGGRSIYVDTVNGDNSGDGTISGPLKTGPAAIAALNGVGTIVLRGGDILGTLSLAGAVDIKVMPYGRERVRVLGGTALSGVTKTAGLTKVYQAALAAAPIGPWIWEHETPDEKTLIADADRHALQRGLTHRLPSTRLRKVDSIAAVDSASDAAWFWEDGTIYFSAADGGDASAQTYYVPGGGDGVGDIPDGAVVEIIGIEAWYATVGFDLRGAIRYVLHDVFAFASSGDGIKRDHARSGVERFCRAGGNGNDGGSGHTTTFPVGVDPHVQSAVKVLDGWHHDNWDDADSLHEQWRGAYVGGLYEYNGDRGIATAAGAHVTGYGGVTRYNGVTAELYGSSGYGEAASSGGSNRGEGVLSGGTVLASEGGVSTDMIVSDWESYGNRVNYSVLKGSTGDAYLEVRNSRSGAAVTSAFRADGGDMIVKDVVDSGSGTLKVQENGGTITVSNGTLVT